MTTKYPRTSSNYKFWKEFLVLYKSLPALWDARSKEYKDKHAKIKGYDEMAAKLSELKPNSRHVDVLRQINIFRTNYRRERARTERRRSNAEKFRTSLWYYNMLSFLDSQEHKKKTRKNMYDEERLEEINCEAEQYVGFENSDSYVNLANISYSKPQDSLPESIIENDYSEIECGDNNELYEYLIENELENFTTVQEMPNFTNPGESVLNTLNTNYDNGIQYFPHEIHHESTHLNDETANEILPNIRQYSGNEYILTGDGVYSNPCCEKEALFLECDHEEDILTSSKNYTYEKVNDCFQSTILNTDKHTVSSISAKSPTVKEAYTMTDVTLPYISNNLTHQVNKEAELLAKSWAVQYAEMSMPQKIFARRAIAEILFAGCMGKLGIHSEKVNIDPVLNLL